MHTFTTQKNEENMVDGKIDKNIPLWKHFSWI